MVRGGGEDGPGVRIRQVEPGEKSVIAAIIELGDRASKTLGFLTPSAFEQAAAKGTLLAALRDDAVVGYALYALPRQQVRLTHLCVAPEFRGRGIARLLVDEISRRHSDRFGIVLKCRRDYGLDDMWLKLGFQPRGEVPGRGKQRLPLGVWWRDHGHPDLFSVVETPALLTVAMDWNVFADLHASHDRIGAKESKGLLADWLADLVELVVTPTLLRELNRISDAAERRRQRAEVQGYRLLNPDTNLVDDMIQRLVTTARERLGSELSTRPGDGEGIRYIAEAATAGVRFLVTRDDSLLRLAEVALDVCQVRILRPVDVAVHVDELTRAQVYQPASLLDTEYSMVTLPSGTERNQLDFLDRPGGERQSVFLARLRELAVGPLRWERKQIRDPDGHPVAFYAARVRNHELVVPFLRVRSTPLADTLARQMLFLLRKRCRELRLSVLRVADPHAPAVVRSAAIDDGFVPQGEDLVALVIDVCGDSEAVGTAASNAAARAGLAFPVLEPGMSAVVASSLERRLWPAKITDSDLETFLVPIQPQWSSMLFGIPASLIPRPEELGISREHVYYRSPHSRGEHAPARILWYGSSDKGQQISSVIGCSRLEEVVVDDPVALHARFQHLGVWSREHVEGAADKGRALALRFADTEMFPKPVSLQRLKALAGALGQTVTVRSTSKISTELFAAVYQEGRSTE
ncbi:hypothetical protein TH66_14595 [Carbonactinospora thermoautotrophica]|uniref:N-acetyltransferase domain-containing protein n=1 Tax=Carbonactinospora thermoautotrophica TaxID=1469144 RepID=A0A132MQM9_9ACTN|nr:GNAT family N-acetyltransferase [Carbonactinospora thermoautotrophica]KWX00139.1 hypothetical protein TH66_14595 [Carbonactinospora thermoautotrophica]KWX01886.1 hypothetical protein LI90_2919 [Carbonactinospora thermoautotrophica]KWX07527.1 hypothetical protein TR74_18515 [Carbonactinospora thermoautotrophica]